LNACNLAFYNFHFTHRMFYITKIFWFTFKENFVHHSLYFNHSIRGHDHLLEIRLLKKSARHDFIIAWHHSSKWQKKWKMVDNQKISAVRVFRAVSLLDKKISTARIANGRHRFRKMSTARHNLLQRKWCTCTAVRLGVRLG
jgi:hypothetical protein